MSPTAEKSPALLVFGAGVVLAVVVVSLAGYVPLFWGAPLSSNSQFEGYCDGVVTFASQGPPPSSGNLTCADIADEEVQYPSSGNRPSDFLQFTGFSFRTSAQDRRRCADAPTPPVPEPYGSRLGRRDGVDVFSCNYATLSSNDLSSASLISSVGGDFMGCRWQCVELARRYLYTTRQVTFGSVGNAYEIFGMKSATRVTDNAALPLRSISNGSPGNGLPPISSMMIWAAGDTVGSAGHVAIVVGVAPTHVDIVEQNWDFSRWPAGQDYSRRLRLTVEGGEEGGNSATGTVHETLPGAQVVGWVALEDQAAAGGSGASGGAKK